MDLTMPDFSECVRHNHDTITASENARQPPDANSRSGTNVTRLRLVPYATALRLSFARAIDVDSESAASSLDLSDFLPLQFSASTLSSRSKILNDDLNKS
ncbi:unnamed protein product [Rhodiola kirilowii]